MSIMRTAPSVEVDGGDPFDFLLPENNEQQLWAEVYARQFPDVEELAALSPDAQWEIVAELQNEVELLEEEAVVFGHHVESLRGGRPAAVASSMGATRKSFSTFLPTRSPDGDGSESMATATTVMTTNASAEGPPQDAAAATSARRGQAYSRKSGEAADVYVALEDRIAMLTKDRDRLRQQREKDEKEGEHLRDLLTATVREAISRIKELRLELLQCKREVLNEGSTTASSDDLVRFMTRRYNAQAQYLDKLNVQSAAAERNIAQTQKQLRQRHAAGEAFHVIDFEQLRIENQQFNERIERKNLELVELKGTSTRTVQTLNTLTDTLNGLTTEQNRLRKDLKSRCEYLARLQREMVSVVHEADVAERKNAAIKAQHEAVHVPKIEHYVAQKAEEYELQKADRHWRRKVEIAEGQLKLVQQQIRVLARAIQSPRRRYKQQKKYLLNSPSSREKSVGKDSGNASMYMDAEGIFEVEPQASGPPVVGGSKALLSMKRSK